MRRFRLLFLLACVVLCAQSAVHAHFLWLVAEPAERPKEVKLYFSETAAPDDPELLNKIADTKAWVVPKRGEPKALEFKKQDDALVAKLPDDVATSPIVLNRTYGVITRGEKPMLLKYYAKASASALPGTWKTVNNAELLPLEVVPQPQGAALQVAVRWKGEPVAKADVAIDGPEIERIEGTTDDKGIFRCELKNPGLYSIRARKIEETAGEHEGKHYDSIRHYSTMAINYAPLQIASVTHEWPALPRGVASFGAAVVDDFVYVYGGHHGKVHHYSQDGESGELRRLNLASPGQWESLEGGPKMTGLTMLAHGGKLYRIGGFIAKNTDADEQDLWSQPDVAVYDPQAKTWSNLTPLPEGRSSHDAAFVGDKLYVVGGWLLEGAGESKWHETALSLDVSKPRAQWTPIANSPFRRRAIAAASWRNKLYVIGGMEEGGNPTTKVAVYDSATDKWSEGPELMGSGMDGFASSACAANDRLYATTMSGSVQRLSEDGARWELASQLEHPRFFHRLLPWRSSDLVVVGGASMSTGKVDSLERLPLTVGKGASR